MKCNECEYSDLSGMCFWPDNNGPIPCSTTTQTDNEKPPLDLMPRKLWNEQRMRDIFDAMERYAAANKPVPLEWVQ